MRRSSESGQVRKRGVLSQEVDSCACGDNLNSFCKKTLMSVSELVFDANPARWLTTFIAASSFQSKETGDRHVHNC